MKAKLLIITVLTATGIFFLSATTWADSRKKRRHNSDHKHFKHVERHNRHHHNHHGWRHHRHHHPRHFYCQHRSHRAKFHRWARHQHKFHHRPYYGGHHKCRFAKKHDHHTRRLVKKHRHHRHYRPVYRHKDGNVSILARTSRRGWKIKISSNN